MKEIKNLTGLRVHRLVVIQYAGKGNGTRPRCKWKCQCDCGNEKIVSTDALVAGITKSCGCLKSPNSIQYNEKLKNRLFKFCKIENECWIWQGKSMCRGYGYTTIRNKTIASHRAAWIAWKGNIPENMLVLHKCDNPSCINPDHLFLGSQLDNMRDMLKKKRDKYAFGENAGPAKLNEKQVCEILNLKGVESSYKICNRFGVAASTIRSIWSGKNWKHLL